MDFRDELFWAAITIAMEAGGEPPHGQLAVAYVIINRAKKEGSVTDAVFRRLQFSCWNSDSPTRMNIDTMSESVLESAWRAASSAYWALVPDPTGGATHYLNEQATRQGRGGTLPSWFDESKVTIRIGRHTFLRL